MLPAAPEILFAACTPAGAEARAQPAFQPAPESMAIYGAETPAEVCGICGRAVCGRADSVQASMCPNLCGNAETSGVGTIVAGSAVDLGVPTGVESVASLAGNVTALYVAEEVDEKDAEEFDEKVSEELAEEPAEELSEELSEDPAEELAGEHSQEVTEEVAEVVAFLLPHADNIEAQVVGGDITFLAPAR